MTLHDHHPSMLASPYSNVSSIPHHPLTNHHDVHRRQVLCTIVCLYSAPSYLKNSLLIFHIKSTIIMIFSHQVAISSMCVRRTTRLFFDDDLRIVRYHARIGADTIGVAYSTKEIHTLKLAYSH